MTEQDALPPAPAPAAPAGRAGGARARSRLRLGAAALALGLVVLAAYLAVDDASARRQAAADARRASALSRQLGQSSAEVSRLNGRLAAAQAANTSLQAEANNPTLPMWNSCGGPCTVGPNSVRVGSVPDTFELQVAFTADVPVRAYFFTFHQWTQFDGCGFTVRCVSGSYRALDAATSMDERFSEAEGCSGYVWVLQADRAGTIKPDVKVRYMPADHPTGVCAGNP